MANKKKTNAPALPNLGGQWLMAEDRVKDLFSRIHAIGKEMRMPTDPKEMPEEPGYCVENHVATIPVIGVLTKYKSWLDEYCGFCPAERLMESLSAAATDPNVYSINLLIDSPGGMVDGTTLFAEAVAKTNKRIMPVYATVSDMCGSGGYWIASQCRSISANDTAFVGCIGVYTVLVDASKFWSEIGVSFTLVSSGGVKGQGADGKITPELVSDVQREITGTYDRFVAVVAEGRRMSDAEARKLADGRSWIAKEAKQLGLIDSVASPDAAMTAITERTTTMTHEQFMSSLAENPNWIAGEREQAKKLGVKEAHDAEKTRMTALREACAGNDALAIDLFVAGKDADDAKLTLAAIERSKAQAAAANAEAAAKIEAQAKEIERLKAEAGSRPAVGTSSAAAEANAGNTAASNKYTAIADDDARIEAEWKDNHEGCKDNYKIFSAYRGYRLSQISVPKLPTTK